VLILSLGYLGYVFHLFSRTFWTSGLGDWVDPYFINFLLEHWHHSVWSFTDPTSPPIYFPVRHTLGYSHSLIFYVPFYLAVRPMLHPFVAYNLALLLVMECGIVCLYLLLRKFAVLSAVEALILSAFFFTSHNVISGRMDTWSQRASVFLIPPIVLLALGSRQRLIVAFLSGLLTTLLLTQDYPTAFFAVFLVVLLAGPPLLARLWKKSTSAVTRTAFVVALLAFAWGCYVSIFGGFAVRIFGMRIATRQWQRPFLLAAALLIFVLVRNGVRVRPWGVVFAAGAIAGVLVFLWIYLPVYREHHAFPEEDLLNSLVNHLHPYETTRPFLLTAVMAILAFKIDKRVLWFLLISVIVFVIPIRFDSFSIWRTFFEPLPGFAPIRDPKRIIYLYELAVVLVTALLMKRASAKARGIITAVVIVLLLTQWNRETLAFERPTAVYDRWVAAPIDIDPSCRSFFIKGASEDYMSRSFHKWTLYGVDSMFVALDHSLPTLNGYSAWMPEGWGLENPQETGYSDAVDKWIRRNGLTDVCVFDIERRTMRNLNSRQWAVVVGFTALRFGSGGGGAGVSTTVTPRVLSARWASLPAIGKRHRLSHTLR